ncbi:MAG: LysR family transcriptional regulator [Eubacteriales bacterium]
MDTISYSIKIVLLGEEKFFGPGTVTLLQNVDSSHSLLAASKQMSLSYSKATAMVKNAETHLGFKLLHSRTGGTSGGGSELTPEARDVIRLYGQFVQDVTECANEHFETLKSHLQNLNP